MAGSGRVARGCKLADALPPTLERPPESVLHGAFPTPYPEKTVNCYLLPDNPVTLIDPGMLYADSTQRLEALLSIAGLVVGQVEQVVLTHAHIDHSGSAGWVAERSGATVMCGRAERGRLFLEDDRSWRRSLLAKMGVPRQLLSDLPGRERLRRFAQPPAETQVRWLEDGEVVVAGGRRFVAHLTPGHAGGHASLWEPDAKLLFSGDHLLQRITPNPLLEPAGPDARRRSLVDYLGSLERFSNLDPAAILPGHGNGFTGIDRLVRLMRARHAERSARILEVVRRLGTPSAYEIALGLGRDMAADSLILGISDVVGHLDLLEDEGAVGRVGTDPLRYAAR